MTITRFPGFSNPVHDAQATFRALLAALSCPGTRQAIAPLLSPPPGLHPACAAACLTLFDLDTRIWLSPAWPDDVRSWLLFYTGCQLTDQPSDAHFAVLDASIPFPSLLAFHWGTAEEPENSATLLIQVDSWQGDRQLTLQGPGIETQCRIDVPSFPDLWQDWEQNYHAYPQGVDLFLFGGNFVVGLPRTTQITAG